MNYFFASIAIASIASMASAEEVSYVDVTSTPEVTTSMVKTLESTSTPYTTTTLSSSTSSNATSTLTYNCSSSSSHSLSSYEGQAVNHRAATAGLGAALGAAIIALL